MPILSVTFEEIERTEVHGVLFAHTLQARQKLFGPGGEFEIGRFSLSTEATPNRSFLGFKRVCLTMVIDFIGAD